MQPDSARRPRRTSTVASSRSGALVLIILAGSAVSISLGVYGRVHDPTGRAVTTLGFATMLDMKTWLTTGAFALGVVQVLTALRMYGRLGRSPSSRTVVRAHRISGVVAVAMTLPVALHCLWSLGYGDYSTRVAVHSVAGCMLYGALVAKLLALRVPRLPIWVIPALGGTLFSVLVVVWWTSARWFFANGSPGY